MARVTRATTRRATAQPESGAAVGDHAAVPPKQEPGDDTPERRVNGARRARATKRVKAEDDEDDLAAQPPSKLIKPEPLDDETVLKPLPSPRKTTQAKKLASYAQHASKSPFPDFPRPTPAEARRVHRILSSLHGARVRPDETVAPTARAGCGDSPSVLDALVRTILSQNTSEANSTRAKRSMDAVYGGSDEWGAIVEGGTAKLQEAIKCGGLSATKSKVIMSILTQTKEKYGGYSLDHLFDVSNEDAMRELIGFSGVGPKTASCVLLFCLRRESFAVDTHVWRITGMLGWRPKSATRDETHAHLDVRIPDEEKYGLHILMVTHGRLCEECKAGGKNLGKCALRREVKAAEVKEDD